MINAVVLGSAGVLKPGKLRWLRALLWAVLLFVILILPQIAIPIGLAQIMGYPLLAVATYAAYPDMPGWLLVSWTSLWAIVALGLYGGLVRLAEKRHPRELDLHRAAKELAIGLAIGALMMAATVLLMWTAGGITIHSQSISSIGAALALSIQTGAMEELVFRLVILRLLWRAFGVEVALLASAILFGAAHIPNPDIGWFAVAALVMAGIMLAGFYVLTGRIWASAGVHAGWNFTQGWIFGAAVSGTSGFEGGPLRVEPIPGVAEIVSGGGFGPEASFAGLLVGTAVGALTLWIAWKRGRLRAAPEEIAQPA